ncbi:MAG: tryptophan synthase subunit alpha [Candidatus Adiutrix sp.]|jgi:tryptophan synthase alpha chain|nr:tryptophan synthase subunit alpha [Candidatus Adiutrix sp.]
MSDSFLTTIIKDNQAQGRLTKVPFIPAAFPTAADFWAHLLELADNGADIIEIGVPFSDPVADGPVVAGASQKALEQGGGLDFILAGLTRHRARLRCGLVLMGYVNPFIQYAWEAAAAETAGAAAQATMARSLELLAGQLAEAGVHGLIAPDLPLEENAPWLKALGGQGLALIPLVGPNTSLEKMRTYAQSGAKGYVYVVSVMGTTGVRAGLPPEVSDTLKRARQAFDLPLALGFGLSSPAQLEAISPADRPEAAVFGSALIRHLEAGGSARDFMAPWNA